MTDYSKLKVYQLKDLCKERGIKGYSKWKKAELLKNCLDKKELAIIPEKQKKQKKSRKKLTSKAKDFLKAETIEERKKIFNKLSSVELKKLARKFKLDLGDMNTDTYKLLFTFDFDNYDHLRAIDVHNLLTMFFDLYRIESGNYKKITKKADRINYMKRLIKDNRIKPIIEINMLNKKMPKEINELIIDFYGGKK